MNIADLDNRELLGIRSERIYANVTRGVRRRLEALASLNRWTLSRTIHVVLLVGLTAYEQELERARSEADQAEQ